MHHVENQQFVNRVLAPGSRSYIALQTCPTIWMKCLIQTGRNPTCLCHLGSKLEQIPGETHLLAKCSCRKVPSGSDRWTRLPQSRRGLWIAETLNPVCFWRDLTTATEVTATTSHAAIATQAFSSWLWWRRACADLRWIVSFIRFVFAEDILWETLKVVACMMALVPELDLKQLWKWRIAKNFGTSSSRVGSGKCPAADRNYWKNFPKTWKNSGFLLR